jgi:predicted  nucleic acid-binding Zn-ribbon protein
MPGPAVILREIHRLRRFAEDLQTRIEQAPRLLKGQQGRVGRQEEMLRQAQEDLKRLKVTIHEKEVSLRTALQQVTKYEKQQNEAGSKKEYDAFQHEIDGARKKVAQLEDEILDAMGQSEEDATKIPELEKALKQVREEVAQYERDSGSRQAGYAEQLQQAQKQIVETEEALPPTVRPMYNRLLAAKGPDALSAVQGRTCTACYTEITAQNYNDLAQGNFVLCKSCGRMLYLPE